jgi:hypothetical protein
VTQGNTSGVEIAVWKFLLPMSFAEGDFHRIAFLFIFLNPDFKKG